MESKGLHVNMMKTKFLVSGVGHNIVKKCSKTPVLSAVMVSATPSVTSSSAHNTCSGSTNVALNPQYDGGPSRYMRWVSW